MPRRLRLHVPGGFYHATLRGNHQQDIFRTPADRALLDAIVERSVEKHPARIHAYCWMTNHLHLFVQVAAEPLGGLMRDIASNYARAFQSKLETTGHLFERRYHAKLVDTERYLFKLLNYIDLNPVDAGLAAGAADYPWSSHRAYAGIVAPQSWLTLDFVLTSLARDTREAHAAYRRCVTESNVDPEFGAIVRGDSEIVGDADFLDRIRGVRQQADCAPRPLEGLLAEACSRFGIGARDLISKSRAPRLIEARAWVAHHAAKGKIATLAEVSRALRHDRATLRHAMRVHAEAIDPEG